MALEVRIKKKLNNFSLDVDFVAEDETFALLGSSGCGKSLTLKCIAGIQQPDSGRIVLDGKVLYDSEKRINLSPQKRNVGFLFQSYALFPNMTVRNNVLSGMEKGVDQEKADEVLEKLHLTQHQDKLPAEISGGQQQRTALARILMKTPKLFLLDEPFSALDSYLKWQMERELMTVLESFVGTTIFVSHNCEEVYRLCDRIGVLEEGRLSSIGPKAKLFEAPKSLSEAMLSGCKNYSEAKKIDQNTVYASAWGVPITQLDGEVPEDMKFVGMRESRWTRVRAEESANCVRCRVKKVVEEISSMLVILECVNEVESLGSKYSEIRWRISKKDHKTKLAKDELIFLKINPKELLVLK